MAHMTGESSPASDGSWVALFSGGKDSAWALHQAQRRGYDISHILIAQPERDSSLFHVPGTEFTSAYEHALGLPVRTFSVRAPSTPEAHGTGTQGDVELEALEDAIRAIDETVPDGISGIISGAVESEYQRDRIRSVCHRYGFNEFAPLWHCDPERILRSMVTAEFDIKIVEVAAAGMDESWVGRHIDRTAISELLELNERYDAHPMGEGGEYETLVLDGPHLRNPLTVEGTAHWDGMRGAFRIESLSVDAQSDRS